MAIRSHSSHMPRKVTNEIILPKGKDLIGARVPASANTLKRNAMRSTLRVTIARIRATWLVPLALAGLFTATADSAMGQSVVNLAWAEKFEGAHQQNQVFALATDPAGNSYITGSSLIPVSSGGSEQAVTIKYGPDGAIVWKAWTSGPIINNPNQPGKTTAHAQGNAIATDAAGNVYVAGFILITSTPSSNPNCGCLADREVIWTAKYDSNGKRLWIVTYDDALHGYKTVAGVAVDAVGDVYVSGSSANQDPGPQFLSPMAAGTQQLVTIKYDASGAEQWEKTETFGGQLSQPNALRLGPRDEVYVAGSVKKFTSSSPKGAIIKYDVNGAPLWSDVFGVTDRAIVLDSEENAYVATSDMVVKYGPSGNHVWTALKGSTSPIAIGLDSSNNVFVAGTIFSGSGQEQMESYDTFKLDANGQVLWEQQYGSISCNVNLANDVSALLVNSFGDVYVTGTSQGNPGGCTPTITTLKYAKNGTTLWTTAYSNAFGAVGLAASGGSLFLAASADSGEDMVTIKYVQDAASESPAFLDFGFEASVNPCPIACPTQAVTLTNTNEQPLPILSITIAGQDFNQTNDCPSALAPGASCTIEVMFVPTASGTRNGSLIISDIWAGSPSHVALTGIGQFN
jgi:hypothetical protein